jgi:SPP1 gp7 family putative phage head morphogenesis protein
VTKAEPTPWRRPWGWKDVAAVKQARQVFAPSRSAEKAYANQLKDVARKVSQVLAAAPTPEHAQRQLSAYAQALEPWAQQAASNMVRKAAKKNDDSWREAAARWGIDLRGMLGADVSQALQERIASNVQLITSIPGQAAARVGELAQEAVFTGMRAEDLAAKIKTEGDVAQGRAKVIALTEVSKAGTALTRARAESVGSEGYIWRTARDGKTRGSHAAMEGKFVRWDSPPTLDGMTGHAGEFPNCRCYPEPVIHDSAGEEVRSSMPTRKEEEASGEHKLRSQWERQEGSLVVPYQQREPLPNVERAAFNMAKLTSYSMDPDKDPNKAATWQLALGADKRHAVQIQRQIMEQLGGLPARRGRTDEYGERFSVLVPVQGPNGRIVDVLTAWIYGPVEGAAARSTVPRMTNCYIPKR